MPENIDEKASNDLQAALTESASAGRIGFRDGFIGAAARAISPGAEQQLAYLDQFAKGREHRQKVDKACEIESIDINELMKRAFDFYYEHRHGGRSSNDLQDN